MSAIAAKDGRSQGSLLHRALLADGVVSVTSGVVLMLTAGMVDDGLGLPASLLRAAAAIMIPYGAALLYVTTRSGVDRRLVWAIVALNLGWAVASLALLATGWVGPTTAGTLFVVVQGLAVAGLADAQFLGLRRAL